MFTIYPTLRLLILTYKNGLCNVAYETSLSKSCVHLTESKCASVLKQTQVHECQSQTLLLTKKTHPHPPRRLSARGKHCRKRYFNAFKNSSYSHFEVHICWKLIWFVILQSTLSEPRPNPRICNVFGLDTSFSRHDFTSSVRCSTTFKTYAFQR